jgi:hypothetical protein
MPDFVLNKFESIAVTQCSHASKAKSAQYRATRVEADIAKLEAELAALQAQKLAAEAECQVMLKEIVAEKAPGLDLTNKTVTMAMDGNGIVTLTVPA